MLFCGLLAYFAHRVLSIIYINYDVGLIPLGSDLLLRGGLIYRDLHTVMLPGSYFMLAAVQMLLGRTEAVCQATATLIIVLSAVSLLRISRIFINGWLVLLPAAMLVILGSNFFSYNSHHWDSLFFFLVFAAILLSYLEQLEDRPVLLVAAGLAAGASCLCYQNQILPVLIGIPACLYTMRMRSVPDRKILRAALLLFLGLALVAVPFLIYLTTTGTLNDMLDCTVGFVLGRYGGVNGVVYGFFNGQDCLMSDLGFPMMIFGSLPLGLIKLAPLIALVCFLVLKKEPRLILLFAMASGLFVAELHKPDLRRLLLADPLFLVLVFHYAEHLRAKWKSVHYLINAACYGLALGLISLAQLYLLMVPADAPLYQTRRGPVRAVTNLSVLRPLNKLTSPDEKILVYPYDTGLLYLSGCRFPSRYPVLHYRYHTAEQFKSVIADMENSKVRYVVWNRLYDNANFSEMGFPEYRPVPAEELIMEPYLKSRYESIKTYGFYTLLRRKDTN
ncbi:MAG: hypothetical protein KC777_27280 [Cyanobacteria bacterium HKST-UBA02]|nr:hypothetical protein [Cyanobacteria bacterium HKST-UBA02]